jgi:predicted MFS family arabinose efflux permease
VPRKYGPKGRTGSEQEDELESRFAFYSVTTVNLPIPTITPAWRVALSGLLALAVAMGIGRFAFTPLLPMMLRDGAVDLQGGGWLATANYVGYFFGALSGMLARGRPTRMIRWGLGLTALLTLGMGITMTVPADSLLSGFRQPIWLLLRAASGIASAWVVVFASGWCLVRLTQLRVPRLGGIIYCGPGLGILVTGLAAGGVSAIGWSASATWTLFGMLAFALSALIWRTFGREPEPFGAAAPPGPAANAASGIADQDRHRRLQVESRVLVFAYGLSGFGYIITATFLPVIARNAMPDSNLHDIFWPLFGACAAIGAWLAVFIPVHVDQRRLLGVCYLMQAAGVLASVLWPSMAGFAFGSILLGLPFTAITLYGMREGQRLALAMHSPANRLMGLLTASFGLGQIAGPPLATQLVRQSGSFSPSLLVAAGALILGAVVLFSMSTASPAGKRA